MSNRKNRVRFSLVLAIAFLLCGAGAARAQTSSTFTYQGRLTSAGAPANGAYDLEFKLYDGGGAQIGDTLTVEDVPVSNGVFTVALDFGNVFDGSPRTLEIGVRPGASIDSFTTLAPRQPLTSAPYAIRSATASVADNATMFGGLTTNDFIQNTPTQQAGNFNLSGDGVIGGNLGIGTSNPTTRLQVKTGTGFYGFTHTDGTTTVGTYVGSSASGASGGWLGTMSNHQLHFFTNNGQPAMTISTTGNVGLGTTTPQAKLHVAGNAAQDLDKGGMVKALLSVHSDGTLERCYNGVTGASTGGCGFSVSKGGDGYYEINFGANFEVINRFVNATTSSSAFINNLSTSAQVGFDSRQPTTLIVRTFIPYQQQGAFDSDFFITVY